MDKFSCFYNQLTLSFFEYWPIKWPILNLLSDNGSESNVYNTNNNCILKIFIITDSVKVIDSELDSKLEIPKWYPYLRSMNLDYTSRYTSSSGSNCKKTTTHELFYKTISSHILIQKKSKNKLVPKIIDYFLVKDNKILFGVVVLEKKDYTLTKMLNELNNEIIDKLFEMCKIASLIGFCHKDFHSDNILWGDNRFYMTDVGTDIYLKPKEHLEIFEEYKNCLIQMLNFVIKNNSTSLSPSLSPTLSLSLFKSKL